MLVHRAAILDLNLGAIEVPMSVGVRTSGGIPNDVSDWYLGIPSEIKWKASLVDILSRNNRVNTAVSC